MNVITEGIIMESPVFHVGTLGVYSEAFQPVKLPFGDIVTMLPAVGNEIGGMIMKQLHRVTTALWGVGVRVFLFLARRLRSLVVCIRGQRRSYETIVQEINTTNEMAEKFVADSDGEFRNLQKLSSLGRREDKEWYGAVGRDGGQVLLTVSKKSDDCPIDLEKYMETINKDLLPHIKSLYLQPLLVGKYFKEEGQLLLVQPFHEVGSLKDVIYQNSPMKEWSEKYLVPWSPLSTDMVAKYGQHILAGVLYLYELGLEPVGHLHTSNIFVDRDVCRVGGYENTLFGYRTRLDSILSDYYEVTDSNIDLIMFGHVIFELTCGYELKSVLPSEKDWSRVTDSALLDVLHFIFNTDTQGQFTADLRKVIKHEFFQSVNVFPYARRPSLPHQTNKDVKVVLSKINRGVVRGKGQEVQ